MNENVKKNMFKKKRIKNANEKNYFKKVKIQDFDNKFGGLVENSVEIENDLRISSINLTSINSSKIISLSESTATASPNFEDDVINNIDATIDNNANEDEINNTIDEAHDNNANTNIIAGTSVNNNLPILNNDASESPSIILLHEICSRHFSRKTAGTMANHIKNLPTSGPAGVPKYRIKNILSSKLKADGTFESFYDDLLRSDLIICKAAQVFRNFG